MISSVEMSMSFMFQYIILLQCSKVKQFRLLGPLIIVGVYKLNMIIQHVIQFHIILFL